MHTCMHACKHVHIHARTHARTHARVRVVMRGWMHACIRCPDKMSPGQNVTGTKLCVLKGDEFLTSNYAANCHIVRNTN